MKLDLSVIDLHWAAILFLVCWAVAGLGVMIFLVSYVDPLLYLLIGGVGLSTVYIVLAYRHPVYSPPALWTTFKQKLRFKATK